MKYNVTIELEQQRSASRPRHARRGNFTTTYLPQVDKVQKELIARKFKEVIQNEYNVHEFPLFKENTPLKLSMKFIFPRPKSRQRKNNQNIDTYRTVKPDLDNLLKLPKDALNGILYHDDAQVVEYSNVEKIERTCEKAYIVIEVEAIEKST